MAAGRRRVRAPGPGRWRAAFGAVLTELLLPEEAEEAARAILRENALALYRLS
jgi:hypothetical protein